MFLYLLLALLPAAAMAACDTAVFLGLFDRVDADHNGQVNITEALDFFSNFDANNDGDVTFVAYRAGVPTIDPAAQGSEVKLFEFIDIDNNGDNSEKDLNTLFQLIAKYTPGVISRSEFEKYANEYCSTQQY